MTDELIVLVQYSVVVSITFRLFDFQRLSHLHQGVKCFTFRPLFRRVNPTEAKGKKARDTSKFNVQVYQCQLESDGKEVFHANKIVH